ncbi:hypothetical protein Tco_1414310, partial [Tanacetum coccineum]
CVMETRRSRFCSNLDPISRKEIVATPYFNSGCHGSSGSTWAYFVGNGCSVDLGSVGREIILDFENSKVFLPSVREAGGVFSLEPKSGVGPMVLDFENFVVRLPSAKKDLGSTAVLNNAGWLRSSVARERFHDDRYDCLCTSPKVSRLKISRMKVAYMLKYPTTKVISVGIGDTTEPIRELITFDMLRYANAHGRSGAQGEFGRWFCSCHEPHYDIAGIKGRMWEETERRKRQGRLRILTQC